MVSKKVFLSALLMAALFNFSAHIPANSESLWKEAEDNVNGKSMFSESKGHQIGDIVTVLIVENSTASNKATTQSSKSDSLNVGAGTGPLKFIPGMSGSTKNDFQGDGSTTRSGTISAKISAKVTKIFPNGNLLIEGKRTIRVNDENQEITVNGLVRPIDVAADNTILSTYLADAEIKYKGNGVAGSVNRPGILKRLSNTLF
ncbi:MAG: flagellar basal body L-ring protein FlgH [Candidatus Wallbacteria bacterium]